MNCKVAAIMTAGLALCIAGCGNKPGDAGSGYGVGDRVIGPEIARVQLGVGRQDIEKTQDEFARTDTVLLSFSVDKVASFGIGSGQYIWIRQDLMLIGADGKILAIQPAITIEKAAVKDKQDHFLNRIALATIKGVAPGIYAAVINVTDLVSFQSTVRRVMFRVR